MCRLSAILELSGTSLSSKSMKESEHCTGEHSPELPGELVKSSGISNSMRPSGDGCTGVLLSELLGEWSSSLFSIDILRLCPVSTVKSFMLICSNQDVRSKYRRK